MRNNNTFVFGVLVALAIGGCAAETEELEGDPEDPAGAMADDELWDEGPMDAAEIAISEDEPVGEALLAMPLFQLPFPCGQVWAGQTRYTHSPRLAVDFNRTNDFGDTVVAAARGTVSRVANEGDRSYGRWIEIRHANGYTTRYAHLSSQAVKVGQFVRKGQKLGNVGNSGGSDGAHLHYELRQNGVNVKARFNGNVAYYYGTRNYRSRNCR